MFGNILSGHTLNWLQTTWYYFNEIVNTVSPTVNFLYDNILTNPIFIWVVLVILILSVFNYS